VFYQLIAVLLSFYMGNLQANLIPDTQEEPVPLNVEQQIEMLDVDILLLKAELARKNGQPNRVANFLAELQSYQTLLLRHSEFLRRYGALKEYAESVLASDGVGDLNSDEAFVFDVTMPIAILPLTGPYASAGESILEGLMDNPELEGLQVFDSEAYDSVFELWELIRLYEPTLILGPLKSETVDAFYRLNTGVPTLAFNQLSTAGQQTLFRTLSPSSAFSIDFLIQAMLLNQYQKVGILYDRSASSQKLKQVFEKRWAQHKIANQAPDSPYYDLVYNFQADMIEVNKSIDRSIAKLLNISGSASRKNWLSKMINHALEAKVRSRNDLDIVVSFLPTDSAVQVSPLLKFYEKHEVIHIWIPNEIPSVEKLSSNLPFWQPTLAFLPENYVSKVLLYKEEETKENTHNLQNVSQKSDVGIFYALGKLSVTVAKKVAAKDEVEFKTQLGNIQINEQSITIKPNAYWLENGALQKLN